MMPVLEIERLSIDLPGRDVKRPVLAEVSLRVAPGEIVALVGESGSGKSVTSRAVLGMYPPRARVTGRIRVDGIEVIGASRSSLRRLRREVAAMVFQDPRASINPLSTIGTFLTETLRAAGVDARQARQRALTLLEAVGIRDPRAAMDRFPHQFSGGMLQRVVIAAAMSTGPRLLLADEPTTMLDVTTQAEVLVLLRKLQQTHGTGMLFVTHDLELAAAISTRMYVMYAGRIVESASTEQMFADPWHPYSRALMNATPRLDPDAPPTRPIAGRPPSLADALPGCAFAPRCTARQDRCTVAQPPLQTIGDRRVACVVATEGKRA